MLIKNRYTFPAARARLATCLSSSIAQHAIKLSVSTRRQVQTSGSFQPLRPPSPTSLKAPRAARQYPRGRRWARRLAILAVISGLFYATDRTVWASGLTRSLRTFGTGLLVATDYKINFRPDPLPYIGAGGIPELHRRNAERLFELLRQNGGLYLKIGQAIAMQVCRGKPRTRQGPPLRLTFSCRAPFFHPSSSVCSLACSTMHRRMTGVI
jgi:aarF domain-containing kinase